MEFIPIVIFNLSLLQIPNSNNEVGGIQGEEKRERRGEREEERARRREERGRKREGGRGGAKEWDPMGVKRCNKCPYYDNISVVDCANLTVDTSF